MNAMAKKKKKKNKSRIYKFFKPYLKNDRLVFAILGAIAGAGLTLLIINSRKQINK